jgi:hypothetical protein
VSVLAAGVLAAGPALAQAVVRQVDVRVAFDGPAPHPLVRERLEATVRSVADRLFLGRPVDQLSPIAASLTRTIADVVGGVATGYVLDPVTLDPGPLTVVDVRLRPVGAVIRQVAVQSDLRVLHPQVRSLAAAALEERAAPAIRALYLALPAAALPWAGPLLAPRATAAVEEALPGFTAGVRAHPPEDGGQAAVDVEVRPRDDRLIRNIGVRFRSSSVPTMLLDQHGPAVVSMAGFLRDLPVAFAQAHAATLAGFVREELRRYAPAVRYAVTTEVGLEVGETTYITVVAESRLYRGRVEARLNVGLRAPAPAVSGHLGRLVAPQLEAFAEVHLVPNTLSLDWHVGGIAVLSPAVTLGAAYALAAAETRVWSEVRVGFDTGLRGTWILPAQAFEGALTYRINAYLSGEIVGTSRGEWWLRLISNL